MQVIILGFPVGYVKYCCTFCEMISLATMNEQMTISANND